MDIQSFIEKIEQEFDDLPSGTLKPDSTFKEVINWNSINSVVLSAMIEFEYKVMLMADDFKTATTITDLSNLIESKMNE